MAAYSSNDQSFETIYLQFTEVNLPKPGQNSYFYWGFNNCGQLGTSDTDNKTIPFLFNALTGWNLISCGDYHTLGVKSDGTLWSWGANNGQYGGEIGGQLGLGDNTRRSSPVQVGSLTTWSSVYGGRVCSFAIKQDGTLWAWGYNGYGKLGTGNMTNYSSPVQVGSLTNWSSIATGWDYTSAVKTDGTLWAWGRNDQGQLGDSSTTPKSSPVQIGSLTTWKQIACGDYHSIAVKTDGTLWSWGRNTEGELGSGTITTRSSPVQVGTLTDWDKVKCPYNSAIAIKTNNTLWSWGENSSGELGLGDVTKRSSPVQVGALTNWSQLDNNCRGSCLSVKQDGSLWAWGYNGFGELGSGNMINRSSPVQVGALTTWSKISAGWRHCFGLTLN